MRKCPGLQNTIPKPQVALTFSYGPQIQVRHAHFDAVMALYDRPLAALSQKGQREPNGTCPNPLKSTGICTHCAVVKPFQKGHGGRP
jgi:hypothetical protein